MLDAIGVSSIDELFNTIPENFRLGRDLNLGDHVSEMELTAQIQQLARQNASSSSHVCLMGGGAYDHFIPAVVDEIASRGEYYTAYTPYQAEASQGSLQTFFEFQSLICALTGMDVANASLYEGGTSVSEAAFMAMRVTRRHKKVVVLESVHPEYRQTLQTYLQNLETELVVVPTPSGTVDLKQVAAVMDKETACLIVQQPNFFGSLEQAAELTRMAKEAGALSIVSVDPLSLGVLKRPGTYGADIVVAEGQGLGIPLQFGGPFLGILACDEKYVRRMPGRLIGKTTDSKGEDCYVLNLQAREQHIRRDKATSNICTNQGLMAIRATVYLSSMGPKGMQEAGKRSCQGAHYLVNQLKANGWKAPFAAPYFKECVLTPPASVSEVVTQAQEGGFLVGPVLDRFTDAFCEETQEQLQNSLLLAVTEKRTLEELDQLVGVLAS
ncbi:putative glycine dehydrogenase (decarboxylating) subunit 1 [Polystyrenella longa]|uniref:glycine dehydrogenase (aminomethyl-transferring) n=2 Tax=Polystyrenella longa TaxID=2528007 RepID=A0A518CM53_9PLAN|nr:putative glycine dehydrogenase (decarboxylating) subunit 1 [Polystyrenella longa]